MTHVRGKPGSYVDPVGAIARGIVKCDALGHADTRDFVRVGVEALAMQPDDERDEAIAEALYEDSGVKYATEQQMAAFIYSMLTSPAAQPTEGR